MNIQSLEQIPNIQKKNLDSLKRLDINNSYDLLLHFPINLINKQLYKPIFALNHGDHVVLKLKVLKTNFNNRFQKQKKKLFRIDCFNETGNIQLNFFNFFPNFILSWLKNDEEIVVSGKVEIFNSIKQISQRPTDTVSVGCGIIP